MTKLAYCAMQTVHRLLTLNSVEGDTSAQQTSDEYDDKWPGVYVGLQGTLPGLLLQLPSLVNLSCSSCQLAGTLPGLAPDAAWPGAPPSSTPLSGNSTLQVLHLARNALGGAIPGDWQQLVNLQVLDLSSNSLSAADVLPANLHTLSLAGNQLTAIPEGGCCT
jgi:Leucine-rich repeat (LRR) protein